MRLLLSISAVSSLGLLLLAGACSTEVVYVNGPTDDGGSSGSTGKPNTSSGAIPIDEDSGTPGPQLPVLPSTPLLLGANTLRGIVGDDAIYIDFDPATPALSAIPIAGGQPTKIMDLELNDVPILSGGAVAIWTNVGAVLGTLNVWTRATGLKQAVAVNSVAGGLFRASNDGTRIAFSHDVTLTGGTPSSAPMAIRDTAAATNAADLTGTALDTGNAFNLTAAVAQAPANCPTRLTFVGNVLFAAFCPGTEATSLTGKIVMVPAGATVTPVRIDATSGAPTVKNTQTAVNSTATKVFVVGSGGTDSGRLIDVATPGPGTTIDTNIVDGAFTPDGTTLLYRTSDLTLKKTSTAAPAVGTTLATGVRTLQDLSRDNKLVMFAKLERVEGNPLSDLNVVDYTAASPAPVAIVANRGALPSGFNADSTHIVFLADPGGASPILRSVPAGGGLVTTVADAIGARLLSAGTGALYFSDLGRVQIGNGQLDVVTVNYVDAVSGAMRSRISDFVPTNEYAVKDKRLVYGKVAQTGSGMYTIALP